MPDWNSDVSIFRFDSLVSLSVLKKCDVFHLSLKIFCIIALGSGQRLLCRLGSGLRLGPILVISFVIATECFCVAGKRVQETICLGASVVLILTNFCCLVVHFESCYTYSIIAAACKCYLHYVDLSDHD